VSAGPFALRAQSAVDGGRADREQRGTFPICRRSGQLGPKVREGDRQAPEGFYRACHVGRFYMSRAPTRPTAGYAFFNGLEGSQGTVPSPKTPFTCPT
jgi:hypothetical protein